MATAAFNNPAYPQQIADKSTRAPYRFLFAFAGVAMAVSSFVMVEPAPYDALLLGLLFLGILTGILVFNGLRPVPVVCMTALLLSNVLSMYDPIDGKRAIWYFLVTLYLALSWVFYISFLWTYRERGMDLLIRTYTFSAMFCVLLGVFSYFHLIGLQRFLLLYGRPKGLFKDPNVYGPYIVPVAMFAVAGLLSRKRGIWSVITQMAVILIATAGIFLSYSRACWINYVISLVGYLALSFLLRPAGSPPPIPISRIVMVAVFGGLSVLLFLQLPAVKAMMAARVTSSGLQGYDRDRFRTQRMALKSATERPFGIGPGQSEEAFDYATHSSYMRVLGENGFLGLAAYVSLVLTSLGRSIIMAIRTQDDYWKKIYLITAGCILGHIVNSGVVDTIHWRHAWFLLALPWYSPQALVSPFRAENSPLRIRRVQNMTWS
jgi:hypothetical protein